MLQALLAVGQCILQERTAARALMTSFALSILNTNLLIERGASQSFIKTVETVKNKGLILADFDHQDQLKLYLYSWRMIFWQRAIALAFAPNLKIIRFKYIKYIFISLP